MQRKFRLVIWGMLTALALAISAADAQDAPPGSASTACAPGATYDPACDVDHDGDVDIFDIQLAAGHWNQAGAWTGGDYWALSGNAGTTPGINVLGTTDSVTLTLVVSGTPALRIEPASDSYFGYSPNLIGGYRGNSVAVGIVGSTIGGGGSELMRCGPSLDLACVNQAHGIFATVSGGLGSTASGAISTVGGGTSNVASGARSTVGGGLENTASGSIAIVSGGLRNSAGGGSSTVSGGNRNTASNDDSSVGGGAFNVASGYSATVGGGWFNTASGDYAAVSGGREASAVHYGELAYASGEFAAAGDAQTSLYVLRRETGEATLTELFLDGAPSGERITLGADRVMTFDILVVASHRFGGGSSAGYQAAGVIRNIGGATSFVGTPIVTVLGENVAGWDVVVEANDTVDALVVKVQGSSGTTIRWVASVRTVEVGR